MKTIIASSHCTRTDFIELQYKTLKKFIKGEYEYIVFNDGSDIKNLNNFNNENIRNEIRNKCNQLGIKCIDIPQYLHKNRQEIFPNTNHNNKEHVSARASLAVQYIYNYASMNNYDKLFLIEADMFIIEELNLDDYNDFDVGFLSQSRLSKTKVFIEYMWIGILIINFSNIKNLEPINFDCGTIFDTNVDSGGFSYFWLDRYINQVKIRKFNMCTIENKNDFDKTKTCFSYNLQKYFEKLMDINSNQISKEFFIDKKVLHLRGAGCNWNYTNEPFKNYLVNKFNNSRLRDNVFLLNNDTLSNEWKNYQDNLSNILYEFIYEIIKN